MEVTAFQAATLAIAAVGAVLGIINTWRAVNQNRVKLKVVPARAVPYGGAPKNIRFCIEITNLSQFAVTVEEAGVLFHHSTKRGSIVTPIFTDQGSWPRRLESRSSVTVYSELPRSSESHTIRCAFARTQCGHVQTGTSPALRAIANER